jgi:hypothetical protein
MKYRFNTLIRCAGRAPPGVPSTAHWPFRIVSDGIAVHILTRFPRLFFVPARCVRRGRRFVV